MTTRPPLFADDEKEEKPKADPWEGFPTHRRASQPLNWVPDADWAEIEDGLTEGDWSSPSGATASAPRPRSLPGDPNPKKPKDDDEDDDDDDDDEGR